MENISLLSAAPRTALMEFIDKLTAVKRLLYIHAPAGYGKTFSTRMWLEHQANTSAWVAINESSGRKPSEFFERFALALLSLQPDNAPLRELITNKSFSAAAFELAEKAVNTFFTFDMLNLRKDKTFLVIDDLHLITNADISKRLPELLRQLPESVTLFIISRAEPPESFSEYMLRNWMAILDIENLRFTEKEISSLFASRERKLTIKQTQDIMTATGGWAIGLNALLLSDNQKYSEKKLNRYLETFIKEQVWEKWDEERRNFLLCVSVSDELNPDFCNAMTGRADSDVVLNSLVRENAFISLDEIGIYRFHHLFQDFLQNLLESENEKLKKELYQQAGDWFYSQGDYYKAVEYYMQCGSKKGIAKGLTLMYNFNSPYASVEDTAAIIRMSVDKDIVDEYPFLLETLAWAAFVEGRGDEMEEYMERYFSKIGKVVKQNPASALTSVLLRCMDYRNNFIEVLQSVEKIPFKRFARANTPSITQNMPFFHRSSRDYSEFLYDEEKSFNVFRNTWGVLLKSEYEVVEWSVRAGFAYERGELDKAHEFALSALAAIQEHFAPETQFCAHMISAAVTDALADKAETRKVLDEAAAMIERHKSYYLKPNLQAFLCRQKLNDGDIDTARDWLKYNISPSHSTLALYKLYRNLTTVRAYIVVGEYNTAIMLLKKLLALCEQYRRSLDVMEIKILMAIAYWKKGTNMTQNEALIMLESAILSADKFGYKQLFLNESAELSNMLHRLQKRIIQKDYAGRLTASQVKQLYIMSLPRIKNAKGLTGGRAPENMSFTERQKVVMKYLCEGLTHNEIAERMGIKFSSVRSHTILIYRKLDVTNITDAMVRIQEMGLLK